MSSHSEITKPEGRRRPGTTPYRRAIASNSGQGKKPLAESRSGREVLPAGTKVGRYELIRLIGEGGMGTVYEAMDARLGRTVALKLLSGKLKGKSKAAKRFSIEAKAAARLANPNAVAIYDFDVDCEYPYIAMEYLQGETLAAAIARGPLAIDRVADIMFGGLLGCIGGPSRGRDSPGPEAQQHLSVQARQGNQDRLRPRFRHLEGGRDLVERADPDW